MNKQVRLDSGGPLLPEKPPPPPPPPPAGLFGCCMGGGAIEEAAGPPLESAVSVPDRDVTLLPVTCNL